ncbi:hypothetical protein GCM10017708_22950 [Arthrobacter citreus]
MHRATGPDPDCDQGSGRPGPGPCRVPQGAVRNKLEPVTVVPTDPGVTKRHPGFTGIYQDYGRIERVFNRKRNT